MHAQGIDGGRAPTTDGKALVGGSVSVVNGPHCSRLCHLLGNGSVDPIFADPNVNDAIAVQPDSRILVSGGDWLVPGIVGFTSIDGLTRHGLARLDAGDNVIFSNGFD